MCFTHLGVICWKHCATSMINTPHELSVWVEGFPFTLEGASLYALRVGRAHWCRTAGCLLVSPCFGGSGDNEAVQRFGLLQGYKFDFDLAFITEEHNSTAALSHEHSVNDGVLAPGHRFASSLDRGTADGPGRVATLAWSGAYKCELRTSFFLKKKRECCCQCRFTELLQLVVTSAWQC